MAQRTVVHFYCDNCDAELNMEHAIAVDGGMDISQENAVASFGEKQFCTVSCLIEYLKRALQEGGIFDGSH